MINRKLRNISLLIVLLLASLTTTFGFSGDSYEDKSIVDIKNDIKDLEEDKEGLSVDLKKLNENDKLESFFTKDLLESDLTQIEFLVSNFLLRRGILNKELLEKSKKFEDLTVIKDKLLILKRDFYKGLVPYIDEDKMLEYLNYVEGEAKIYKERKDLVGEISAKKEILETKVQSIEEQIKRHRNKLSEELRIIIEEKTTEKIDVIKNSDKFNSLDIDSKKRVLQRTIVNIRGKITLLDRTEQKTDILVKKLEVYKIVLDRMVEFRENIN